MLFVDKAVRFTDVQDGASNTLFVGERPAHTLRRLGRWHGGWGSWFMADSFLGVLEVGTDPNVCPEHIPFSRDRLDAPCSAFHFWSLHPGGGHFLFVDGSVRFLTYSADPLLPALATRDGGEVIPQLP